MIVWGAVCVSCARTVLRGVFGTVFNLLLKGRPYMHAGIHFLKRLEAHLYPKLASEATVPTAPRMSLARVQFITDTIFLPGFFCTEGRFAKPIALGRRGRMSLESCRLR
jgi:hypothetical protein